MKIIIGYFIFISIMIICWYYKVFRSFNDFDFIFIIPEYIGDFILQYDSSGVFIIWGFIVYITFYSCVYFLNAFIASRIFESKRHK